MTRFGQQHWPDVEEEEEEDDQEEEEGATGIPVDPSSAVTIDINHADPAAEVPPEEAALNVEALWTSWQRCEGVRL